MIQSAAIDKKASLFQRGAFFMGSQIAKQVAVAVVAGVVSALIVQKITKASQTTNARNAGFMA